MDGVGSAAVSNTHHSRPSLLGRQPALRLLWAGELTSALGTSVAAIALPLVAVSLLNAGPAMMGLLEAAVWLPWLMVGLPAGAWIDRWTRRRVMIACDLISLAAFLAVPVAHWIGHLSVPLLLTVALTVGTTNVFFSTSYRAFLRTVVDPPDLQPANALLQGSESAVGIAGPGFGGLLAQLAGPVIGLLFNAATFLVSAACLLQIQRPEPPAAPRARSSLLAEIRAGITVVARDPYIRVLAGYAAIVNAVQTGMGTLTILFLVRELKVSAAAVGVLLAAEGVGGLLGASLSSRFVTRLGSARTLLLCAVGLFPIGLLMPLAWPGPGLALFVVGAVVPTVGVVAFNIVATTFRQIYCPPRLLGRVTASSRVLAYAAAPGGALVAGTLGATMGIRAGLLTVLSVGALSGLILLLSPIARLRDLPTTMCWAEPEPSNEDGLEAASAHGEPRRTVGAPGRQPPD